MLVGIKDTAWDKIALFGITLPILDSAHAKLPMFIPDWGPKPTVSLYFRHIVIFLDPLQLLGYLRGNS